MFEEGIQDIRVLEIKIHDKFTSTATCQYFQSSQNGKSGWGRELSVNNFYFSTLV